MESKTINKTRLLDPMIVTKDKILSNPKYTLINCPEALGDGEPERARICFGGKGDAEDFIEFFTEDIARLGSGKVFWQRNFGLWVAEFDFKDIDKTVVVGMMMKGDSEDLSKDKDMKDFDMLINLNLYTKQ